MSRREGGKKKKQQVAGRAFDARRLSEHRMFRVWVCFPSDSGVDCEADVQVPARTNDAVVRVPSEDDRVRSPWKETGRDILYGRWGVGDKQPSKQLPDVLWYLTLGDAGSFYLGLVQVVRPQSCALPMQVFSHALEAPLVKLAL